MTYPFDDEVEIGHVYLDSQRVAISQTISGEFMRANLRLTEERDAILNRMIYEISTKVRSHNLPPEQVEETRTLACDHPADWWQQWKHDVAAKHWALRWIVRRRPVQFTRTWHKLTVTMDLRRFRVYPDAPNIGAAHWFAISFMNHTRSVNARWDDI